MMFTMRRMALSILLSSISCFAQLNRGTITGTVTDLSGAVIPGVKVTIQNTATNFSVQTETTDVGQYHMPGLQSGPYQITFEAPSFKRLVRSGFTLSVTDVLRVDVQLEIGSVADAVEVTGELPRVNTDSAEVGTNLPRSDILNLPLSINGGRYPETFAYALTPGVAGDSWASHVNGSTTASKEVLLDGATVSTYRAGHFGETSVSMESLQELKIQTSGQSAEFGNSQAGVMNFVMKSGTNQIHGSGFFMLRNEFLNANTFTNNARGLSRPLDRKMDYASSFGAPVYIPKVYNGKNRTFFYTTYERYKQRALGVGSPTLSFPVPEFYAGDFSRLLQSQIVGTDALGRPVQRGAIYDPATFRQLENGRWVGDVFPGNIIPADRISAVAKNINAMALNCCMPVVKDASGNYALQQNAPGPFSTTPMFDQYNFSIKGDHIINSNNRLSGSLSYNYRPRIINDQGKLFDPSDLLNGGPFSSADFQNIRSHLVRLTWDATITPRVLHNFTVYYNRMINAPTNQHSDINGAQVYGIQNLSSNGYPVVNWGGGPYYPLAFIGDTLKSFNAYMGDGLTDSLSFSSGRHFVKMGIDFRRNYINQRSFPGPSFNFNARATAIPNEAYSGSQTGYAFASYLLGIVDSGSYGEAWAFGEKRNSYAAFIQDDFKVSRKLTLNLGLRWDVQTPFTESHNRIAVWDPNERDPISGLMGAYAFAGDCSACTGKTSFGKTQWTNLAPRIGFAWNAFQKWTFRGSYGIFYLSNVPNEFGSAPPKFPWVGTYNLAADPINPWQGIFNWDNGFPTDRYMSPSFDKSYANRNTAFAIDPSYLRVGYSQQWNLNIQRELPSGLVLDVGYIGNKGTALPNADLARLNQIPASMVEKYGATLANSVSSPEDAAKYGIAYPYPGFKGTVGSALRQYPQIRGTDAIALYGAPLGFSSYHSLQITVNKRLSKGLAVYGNYTWSKTLGNVESSVNGTGQNSGPVDYYNLKLEKTPLSYDIPHMVKAYVSYQLPIGKGQALLSNSGRLVNAIVGGWSASVVMNYYSGAPLALSGASVPTGFNGSTNRINVAAGELKNSAFEKDNFNFANFSSPSNSYLNKAMFSEPAPGTFGTAAPRYTSLRGMGIINEDLALQKNMNLNEQFKLQLRIEFSNMFNRHVLSGLQTNVTSPLFGQFTDATGNRTGQIGLRLDF